MSKLNSITVSSKVGIKVPEMSKKLTDAFHAVQSNYCDDTVVAFTETVKVIRLVSKEVYSQIAGGEIATGLVGMMIKHDGSMIVKRPGEIVKTLEAINAMYDTGTEVPSAEFLWLDIAAAITFVPENSIVVEETNANCDGDIQTEADEMIENDGEQLCSNLEIEKEGNDMSTVAAVTETTENEKKIDEAISEFADAMKELDIEITNDIKEFGAKMKAKTKADESSTTEKIVTGVAVGVGVAVVGAGLYYAAKAIFGNDDSMGDLI